MKKTNLIILIVLIIGTGAFLMLRNSETDSTLEIEASFFQLEDTAGVTKIFTADIDGNKVLLEKRNFYWLVNSKYRADRGSINNLFEPLVKMYVKAPVSDAHREEMIKEMTVGHKKVEIYRGDELARVYFIGNATSDGLGTYVYTQDEQLDRPYMVHIPGWNGNLGPRFFTGESSWRSKKLFHTSPPNIDYLQVDYQQDAQESYKIAYDNTGEIHITSANGAELDHPDVRLGKEVLVGTNKIYLEDFLSNISQSHFDSVMQVLPEFARISIRMKNGKETVAVLKHYESNPSAGIAEEEFPIDRFYVYLIGNERETIGLLQKAMGAKLLKKFDRFELSK